MTNREKHEKLTEAEILRGVRQWEATYRVLVDGRWQDDACAVEGGDDEMARDNARRLINRRWGRDACYKALLVREVCS